MKIAAEALIVFAKRYSAELQKMASQKRMFNEEMNCFKWRKFATMFLPMRRVLFGKLCNITGSYISE